MLFGLALDQVYSLFNISARAVAGQASEIIPPWVQLLGAFVLLALSARPVYDSLRSLLMAGKGRSHEQEACDCQSGSGCKLEAALPVQILDQKG